MREGLCFTQMVGDNDSKAMKHLARQGNEEVGRWGQGQLCHSPTAEDMICEYVGQITSRTVTIHVPVRNWVPEGKVQVPWLGPPSALNLEGANLKLCIISFLHPTDVRSDCQCT